MASSDSAQSETSFPGWVPEPLSIGALPDAWCKEDLSIAYAMAIGTAIGVACDQLKRDINGWDILYRSRDTAAEDARQLAVQLKCTVQRLRRIDDGETLSFQIDAAGYDHLRKAPTHPPRLLVIVEVRDAIQNHWIEPRLESLRLHASAWFANLAGAPSLNEGQQSTSVRIPVAQHFDPAALRENMRSCP